jgi:hypothetical protein
MRRNRPGMQLGTRGNPKTDRSPFMGYRPDMRRPGPKGAANDFLSARHIGWEPGCRISPVPDQRRLWKKKT